MKIFYRISLALLVFIPTLSYAAIAYLTNPSQNNNEIAVRNNIDSIFNVGSESADLTAVINSLQNETDSVINDALDQMHPAIFGAFAEEQVNLGGQFLNSFHRSPRLDCAYRRHTRLWFEPFGNWLEEKNKGMQTGFNATTKGFDFGIDHEFFNCWNIGIGGAYSITDTKWSKNRGYAYIDGLYGAFYTDLWVKNFYLASSGYAGKNYYTTARHLQFTTIDRQATAHFTGFDAAVQLTMAYFFGNPACLLYPYLTGDYLYLYNQKFSESGADSLNLHCSAYRSTNFRGETGIAFQFIDRNLKRTICVSPLLSFGYVILAPIHRDRFHATFSGQNASFRTKGWDLVWQLFNMHFGLNITYRWLNIDTEYIGDFSTGGDRPFFNQRANMRFSGSF